MQQNMSVFAIDMGSSRTKVYSPEKGMIFSGDSFAVKDSKKEYLDISDMNKLASMMLPSYTVMRPVIAGEIADIETAQAHIMSVFSGIYEKYGKSHARAVMCVKKNMTEMQRQAYLETARAVGLKDVFFADSIVSCVTGSLSDIRDSEAVVAVDIGSEKTEAAVIAFHDCVTYECINIGGSTIDKNITDMVIRNYGVEIGRGIAGEIKKASTFADVVLNGKNCSSGIPDKAAVSAEEIIRAVYPVYENIAELIISLIAKTPPELMTDIVKNGIILFGGCAKAGGLCELISQRTGIKTTVSDMCDSAAAIGAGEAAKSYLEYKNVTKRKVSA